MTHTPMHTTLPRLVLAALLLTACVASHAQRMYRCGNTYQQTPCAGADAGAGKEIRNFGGSATTSVAMDAASNECKQRGVDSQKIVWARESGQLSDQQISELSGKGLSSQQLEERRNLIAAVYAKRGSAPEIRTAIEADCLKEKKQAEEALALAALLAKQQKGSTNPGTSATATPPASPDANAANPDAAQREASARAQAQQRATQCSAIGTQIQEMRNSQRSGGSVATMETLNQRIRDLDREKSRANCP